MHIHALTHPAHTHFLLSHSLTLARALLSLSLSHTHTLFSHSPFLIFPITFSLLLRLSGLRVRKPGSPLTNSLGASDAEAKALLLLQKGKTEWKRSFESLVQHLASAIGSSSSRSGHLLTFPWPTMMGSLETCGSSFLCFLPYSPPHPHPFTPPQFSPRCTSRRSPPSLEQKFIFS